MEEQQIEIEIVAADVERDLSPYECEPCAQFPEGVDDAVHECLFQVTLSRIFRQLQEVKQVRVLGELLGEFGIRRGQFSVEV